MGLFQGLLGNASEVDIEKTREEFAPILIQGERIERAYRVVRDVFVFTDKRLILADRQGMTGSKVDYQSIPYRSIVRFSKESVGVLDLDAELKIWLSGAREPIVKKFAKNASVNEVYRLISEHTLR